MTKEQRKRWKELEQSMVASVKEVNSWPEWQRQALGIRKKIKLTYFGKKK